MLFVHRTRSALEGKEEGRVNVQGNRESSARPPTKRHDVPRFPNKWDDLKITVLVELSNSSGHGREHGRRSQRKESDRYELGNSH
jgi:hypothetical protein